MIIKKNISEMKPNNNISSNDYTAKHFFNSNELH